MSQDVCHTELREKTRQLLQGPLKHIRAAALAAARVPLVAVTVSQAVAQECPSGGCPPPAVPSPCDFVTSGGFVATDFSAMANFGAHGGCKRGAFWGHVNYVDHGTGDHVDSTQITGYLTDPAGPPNNRDICGWARVNGAGPLVRFRVRLIDNGDFGTSDQFGIRLDTGYFVTTRNLGVGGPGGGNVELHSPNPSTTAPDFPPTDAACGVGEP